MSKPTDASANKQGRFRKLFRKKMTWKFFLLLLGVIFILTIAGCSTLYYVGGKLIDEEKLNDVQTSQLLDINGNPFADIGGMRMEKATIDEIPKIVQDAFIAVEDKRFYSHNGVDPIGIARAIVKDIISMSRQEGASTITQQLARNIFLPDEAQQKTFMRKTKEIMIALNLERNYSKEQILEMYLNRGFYAGHGVFGVKKAADYYFGKKNLNDLTIAEVATLAAIPKAPTYYAPTYYEDPKEFEEKNRRALERRNLVLSIMHENGVITKEQMEAAQKEPLVVQKPAVSDRATYQAYIDHVIKEAEEKLGIPEDQLYSGGYKIYTYLDKQAQVAAYEKFQNDANFPNNPRGYKDRPVQGAMVILEAKTGGISAIIGRRDYQAKGYSFATAPPGRQPGSSMKPLVVYAPALEKGWTPNTIVQDVQKTYGNYTPRNHNNAAPRGPIPMHEALKHSLNLSAVWTLNEIGLNYGISYLEKFGIEVSDNHRNLSIALGSQEVTPLKMAQAYSAFANNGIMTEAHAIKKITTHDGRVLVTEQIKETQVVSPQTAYYMTEMLKGVVRGGTGTAANLGTHPVAGKTGTTEFEKVRSGNRDAWFVGYTPDYVAAIWMGYDKTDENHYIQDTGGGKPAAMFRLVMSEALKGKPVKQFAKPEGVVDIEPYEPMPTITDLKAVVVRDGNKLKVQITWTASANEEIAYKLYRFRFTTLTKELIAEGRGNAYYDDYKPNSFYSYVVVPYNTRTGEEGNMSNIANVQVPDDIQNSGNRQNPGSIIWPGIGNDNDNNGNNNNDDGDRGDDREDNRGNNRGDNNGNNHGNNDKKEE